MKNKETQYQLSAKSFIEGQYEAYNGRAINIYTEEFSKKYDNVLQECSPLIGGIVGNDLYNELKIQHGIVGLREKINEFNKDSLLVFLKKHKRADSINEVLEKIFQDFLSKYKAAQNEAQLYELIFLSNSESPANTKREIFLSGIRESFSYNVIYYEKPGKYIGKNNFYTIRERRIPVFYAQRAKEERPDFLHYINGIPLILIEYKTENSGIIDSLKDFEFKESYKKAPFKVALNDGRDVLFFSDINCLKFKTAKDNSFMWVHYLNDKKYIGQREFTNTEYLLDELLCQPENLYSYCTDGCSLINHKGQHYLINARIQQYYAIKDIRRTLIEAQSSRLTLPYNFEFAHAQRSGKTITMKLIVYMIEQSFGDLFNTVFMYTPDLQIKDVINQELSKSGNSKINLKMVESRREYQEIINDLYNAELLGKNKTGMTIYIVNMQKITDEDLKTSTAKIIKSDKILNILDEAHHGQTKDTANIRLQTFPNASNYLFTATGKDDMYLTYFPDNCKKNRSNVFTISNARNCKITVPVKYLKAQKHFNISPKAQEFTKIIERQTTDNYLLQASIAGIDNEEKKVEEYLESIKKKVAQEIEKIFNENIEEKLSCITFFMDSMKVGLPFAPKAIVYVDSVERAKKYIEFIQSHNADNYFKNYHFGVDFSSIDKLCSTYNPGMNEASEISANFQKNRDLSGDNNKNIIDILIAVDKYQKGFDLPSLLITFLDTKISEISRMNQIYTRSATKFNGKVSGYCVDLTLDDTNEETFKQSLLIYDSADVGDTFIDDSVLTSLHEILAKQFKELKAALQLNNDTFTANMILQQVLNEADLRIREQRQHSFFTISKNIINSLGKMGGPLFYKPFNLELKALYEAFSQFKLIYGDKSHPEHHKIIINTDKTFIEGVYITNDEIRHIIAEALQFLKENHIKDIIDFHYTHKQSEVIVDNDSLKEVNKKFSQDLKKNNLEQDAQRLTDYLKKNNRPLFDLIEDMLRRISGDRGLIYEEVIQEQLDNLQNQLNAVKEQILLKIEKDFQGNHLLFWLNETGNQVFTQYGAKYEEFIYFVSQEIYKSMKTIISQIDNNLSHFDKSQLVSEIFIEKTNIRNFSAYFANFRNSYTDKNIPLESLKVMANVPLIGNTRFYEIPEIFKDFLLQSLRQYYQNSLKN